LSFYQGKSSELDFKCKEYQRQHDELLVQVKELSRKLEKQESLANYNAEVLEKEITSEKVKSNSIESENENLQMMVDALKIELADNRTIQSILEEKVASLQAVEDRRFQEATEKNKEIDQIREVNAKLQNNFAEALKEIESMKDSVSQVIRGKEHTDVALEYLLQGVQSNTTGSMYVVVDNGEFVLETNVSSVAHVYVGYRRNFGLQYNLLILYTIFYRKC
jgi:chromosome segregation ATPase